MTEHDTTPRYWGRHNVWAWNPDDDLFHWAEVDEDGHALSYCEIQYDSQPLDVEPTREDCCQECLTALS